MTAKLVGGWLRFGVKGAAPGKVTVMMPTLWTKGPVGLVEVEDRSVPFVATGARVLWGREAILTSMCMKHFEMLIQPVPAAIVADPASFRSFMQNVCVDHADDWRVAIENPTKEPIDFLLILDGHIVR